MIDLGRILNSVILGDDPLAKIRERFTRGPGLTPDRLRYDDMRRAHLRTVRQTRPSYLSRRSEAQRAANAKRARRADRNRALVHAGGFR